MHERLSQLRAFRQAGLVEAERIQHPRLQHLGVGLFGRGLNHQPHRDIIGIRVTVLGAGGEIQRLVPCEGEKRRGRRGN